MTEVDFAFQRWILKSLSHHSKASASHLIKYVFDGRKSLLGNDGKPLIIKQHLRSFDKQKWINQYKELESIRKSKHSRAVTMYHEVLSFSPQSSKHLTKPILTNLIKKFIDLRCSNQLVVSGVHFEKNIHAHILISGTNREGRSARISKARYAEIKNQLQAYQQEKYPELSDSIVMHGRKKKCLSAPILRVKNN